MLRAYVSPAAGAEGNDDPDGTGGVVLGRHACTHHERNAGEDRGDEKSRHDVPPFSWFLIEDRLPAIAAQSGRRHIRDHIARLACGLALADINVTHVPLVAGPALRSAFRPKRKCAGRQNRLTRSRMTPSEP